MTVEQRTRTAPPAPPEAERLHAVLRRSVTGALCCCPGTVAGTAELGAMAHATELVPALAGQLYAVLTSVARRTGAQLDLRQGPGTGWDLVVTAVTEHRVEHLGFRVVDGDQLAGDPAAPVVPGRERVPGYDVLAGDLSDPRVAEGVRRAHRQDGSPTGATVVDPRCTAGFLALGAQTIDALVAAVARSQEPRRPSGTRWSARSTDLLGS
jgi:hypothetical protein